MPLQNAPAVELTRRRIAPATYEWRDSTGPDATGDGSFTILGHAAVTGQMTTLYEDRWWVLREQINPGAFGNVLASRPDVHLNIGHDGNRSIARTGVHGVGELDLNEDQQGLRVFARVDPEDLDVQALAPKMRRGIMDQMSFAFRVARDEWLVETDDQGRDVETRTILEIGTLYDVCVCAQGAYAQTDASLRSLMTALGRAGTNPAGRPPTSRAGDDPAGAQQDPVAPDDPAGGDRDQKRRLITMRTDIRRRALVATLPKE